MVGRPRRNLPEGNQPPTGVGWPPWDIPERWGRSPLRGGNVSKSKKLKEKVEGYLNDMGLAVHGDEPYLFRRGSTAVAISLRSNDRHTFVRVTATMLTDVEEPTPDLLFTLNRLNGEVHHGAFILFDDGNLCFAITLLGDRLDRVELEEALDYVSDVGDAYDERLQDLAGGLRVKDVLDGEDGP